MYEEKQYDAVVVGGGFYGCAIAVYLARERNMQNILLLESEPALLSRASYSNQARVHSGYHYPRSFTTAYRSRINAPAFMRDWAGAIKSDFTKLYAIARSNSKVTANQFERFCHEIGANLEPVDTDTLNLFEPRLIEAVYAVSEYAFDSTKLADWAKQQLAKYQVDVRLQSTATAIDRVDEEQLQTTYRQQQTRQVAKSDYIFNCTYSGLNQLSGSFPGTATKLRHEITEMALIDLPDELKNIGITVMDGPFFSVMPFPARQLHTLSHVRYTPHTHWDDSKQVNPREKLQNYTRQSRIDRMLRDVQRYMPAISRARYVESLYEVKTILAKNDTDDGRPILFERHPKLPGCYSILGGKIDNIYDVLEKLDSVIPVVAI